MADYGITDNGTIELKVVSVRPEEKKRKKSVVIATASERVLSRGTLVQKVSEESFFGSLSTGGIDASVTTIPLSGDSGEVTDGSIIRIGDELIEIGTYDSSGNELTGCTRGVWGTTAAAHSEGDDVDLIESGQPVEAKYEPWDGKRPIEGYINETVDASSADAGAYIIFDDDVNRSAMLTASADVPVPTGFDNNSLLNFVEVE